MKIRYRIAENTLMVRTKPRFWVLLSYFFLGTFLALYIFLFIFTVNLCLQNVHLAKYMHVQISGYFFRTSFRKNDTHQ